MTATLGAKKATANQFLTPLINMKIAALFSVLMLSGCATYFEPSWYSASEATGNQSDIHVTLTDPISVNEKCVEMSKESNSKNFHGHYLACAQVRNYLAKGRTNCKVVSPKPSGFMDKEKLSLLGHEILHCLGVEHVSQKPKDTVETKITDKETRQTGEASNSPNPN